MPQFPIAKEEAASNLPADIIFSLITCGIYMLFWKARQFRAFNAFLGAQKYEFWKWFLLSIVTCGIWLSYSAYLEAQDTGVIQEKLGRPVNPNLPVLHLLLCLFGLSIVSMAIEQDEINKWFN